MPRRLAVRVVVGPWFADTLCRQIDELAADLPHDVEVLTAPPNLAPHMAWSDVAVSLSGLTKYELAATGTPAILLSLDATDAMVNKAFADQGSAIDLGAAADVAPGELARVIGALFDDFERRRVLASRGQTVVDGSGAKRILSNLRAVLATKT